MEPVIPSVFDEMETQRPVYFAGTWLRFFNFVIDYVAWYACVFLTGMALGVMTRVTGIDMVSFFIGETIEAKLWQTLLACIVWIAYYTLVEGASKGRSLGKLITRTKAVTDDGGPLTWKLAFKRSLCRLIPFEPFSGFGGHPWHDTITKTCVVKIS